MLRNIIIIQDFASINGGNAKVALTSAIGLKKNGYNVVVFSGMGPVYQPLIEAGVEVICLNQNDLLHSGKIRGAIQGLWNSSAEKKLSELLKLYDNKETIVHLHGWNKVLSPSIWKPLRKGNFKIVVTLHDFFLFCPNLGLFNYQTQKICNQSPSSLQCFLCNCDSRNYLQKWWRNIRQVIQMHEMEKYGKFSVISIGELNERLGRKFVSGKVSHWFNVQNPIDLNQGAIVDVNHNDLYLFVGRLSPEKGIDLFCKCITELKLKGCVLGGGYLLEKYRMKYPNIQFAGWVNGKEKESYIRKAKALVFPSIWYEGAPLTPVEMLSYGIPCIVPDKCAASEKIVDGKNGYIFCMGDLDSLKACVTKLEQSDLRILQKSLLDIFDSTQYSMASHLLKLEECYNELLDN